MSDYLAELFNNKNITESSKKLYIKNLQKLNDNRPIKNLNFLKNMDIIKQKLENYKENTKRNYYISIVSALKTVVDKDKKYKSLYDKYSEILDNYNKELKDQSNKTDNENKNWMDWNEVDERFKSLYDEIMKMKNKKKLSSEEYNTLCNAVLLGLYVLHPPRRNKDYQQMLIVKNIPDDASDNYNYLDLKKKQFIFNQYKTRGKYEKQTLPVNEEYLKLIKVWIRHHPFKNELNDGAYLLVDKEGKPLKQVNDITNRLNKIFGKKVGASMLRKIYLSSKYSDKAKELKEDTEAMGTSTETAQNNYIKKD